MNFSKYHSSFSLGLIWAKLRKKSVNRDARLAFLFVALLALLLSMIPSAPAAAQAKLAPVVASAPPGSSLSLPVQPPPAPQPGDLFNNFNIGGVNCNPPQKFTLFTLTQLAQITQLETYHFPQSGCPQTIGNIGIWNVDPRTGQPTGSQPLRAFAAQWAGTGNSAWLADSNCNPGCYLPRGVYAIEDSSPQTWSWNSQSGGGFAIVRGGYVAALPPGGILLTTTPAPVPVAPPPPVQFPCVSNPAAFSIIDSASCVFTKTENMILLVERPLTFGSFTSVYFNWLPAQGYSVNPLAPPPYSPTQMINLPAGGSVVAGGKYTFTPPVAAVLCPMHGQGSLWQVTPVGATTAYGAAGVIMLNCN